MGGASSINTTETVKNEFMLQRQKPVNGSDVKNIDDALKEIAKLRTLCRLVDPRELDEFLHKFHPMVTGAIHDNPVHDFKIIHSNISSVPNPILPNNYTPDLMPTVYANEIPLGIPGSPIATEAPEISRPITPLKPCIKTHARAHSAATKKRRVFINDPSSGSLPHSSSEPIPHTLPQVRHDESTPTASMFGITVANPDYEPSIESQSRHEGAFSAQPKTIKDAIKLRLDHRMVSLHEAFKFLDVTNSGFVTQEELLNACWYWGVQLDPKDFALFHDTYSKGGVLNRDTRIDYNEFIRIMTRILRPAEEGQKESRDYNHIDDVLRSKLLNNGLTMRQTFTEFDKDGSNCIDREEMKIILRTYGISFTEEHLTNLFRDFDSNRDGKFQYSEFVKMMQGVVGT